MTKQEMQIASNLLEIASDTFSNHGCNDFELPNTQETIDFLNAMEKWSAHGGEPEEVHVFDPLRKIVCTYDWLLMKYLAARLNEDQAQEKP